MIRDIILLSPGILADQDFGLRWIKALNPQRRLSLQKFLRSADRERVGAVCIFGPCNDLLKSTEAGSLITGKGIIHVGKEQASAFHDLGAEAVMGYRDDPAFLINEEEELFRDALLAGARAVAKGRRFEDSVELQRRAWSNVLTVADSFPLAMLAHMLAKSNLEAFYSSGDRRWRMSGSAHFVWVDASVEPSSEHIKPPETPRIEVVDVTGALVSWLQEDPNRLLKLSPEAFEDFVLDRIIAMDFQAQKIGSTFQRDGGIDILAWPKRGAVPFLLAVQVKHSKRGKKVGPDPVRSLQGVLAAHPLDVGMIVTNTSFTPDARWVAARAPHLTRLKDFDDLKFWIQGEFSGESAWRDIPSKIEIAPGIWIPIPKRLL